MQNVPCERVLHGPVVDGECGESVEQVEGDLQRLRQRRVQRDKLQILFILSYLSNIMII